MKIVKYNLSKAGRKYTNNQNEEKTVWENIGTMTEFHKEDGAISRQVEIPAIGLVCNAYPMEKKTKVAEQPKPQAKASLDIEYPTEEINPEDLPF